MRNNKLFLFLTIVMSFFGCGLEKMASDYDKVTYEQTPTVLEVHGGDVVVDLKGSFPEKYFAKKATVEIIPVIIGEDGVETKLKSVILQGEQATGGEETIFFESGGDFTYSDKIKYKEGMINSSLELRALATLEDDNKILGPVIIAKGVVATSMRVENDEIVAVANHGYKEVETISETATIYFLVNKSNIRTTEKSDEDVQKLKNFIELGYKTESFVIKSSSSPEGTEKINTELSDNRQNSTLTYAKYLLKKLKAEGSFNDDHYKLSSAGADWEGFNNLVKNSSILEKSTILSLTDRNKEKSQKEKGELLQDMAQVYDALENDVLQYLRKSEITINSYKPKKTREEIVLLSTTNPSELSVEELLYSATLKENSSRSLEIYNTIVELHNDWRAYNNIAVFYLSAGNLDKALENLNQAKENGGANESSVLTNFGIIASWNGELNKAQKLFDKANTGNYNKGNLNLRRGDYRSACRYYRGQDTYNATLASILYGNNNSTCSENTAACYYLNAIAGARSGNTTMLFKNLEKAIQESEMYKNESLKDLEFLNYRDHEKFISLTK
ncbi:MAG: hypothetical protein CMD22_00970 [Flavobacteriales bacterium]|nr:hypothetical protein [Flavobacteriales bacterium]|tara:strand:- start:2985 stop:4661 length:1677 start_codon:yes stop_codon:yes gene_type:complete